MHLVTLVISIIFMVSIDDVLPQDSGRSRHGRQSNPSYDAWSDSTHGSSGEDHGGVPFQQAVRNYGPSLEQMLVMVNCSRSCNKRETMKQLRLDSIKQDILKKLKITTPPVVNRSEIPDIPAVRDMQQRMQRDAPDFFYRGPSSGSGRPDHMYSPQTSNIISLAEYDSTNTASQVIHFTLDETQLHRDILLVKAILGVNLRPVAHSDSFMTRNVQKYFTLTLYSLDNRGQSQYYRKKRISVTTRGPQSDQWVELDVTSLVQDWLRNPQLNQGVRFEMSPRSDNDFEIITRPLHPEQMRHRPYLEMTVRQIKDEFSSRNRRSIRREDCDERGVDKLCCRYPLVVNFDDFGWDWIIAPRQYSAYYCAGDCPFAYVTTNTNAYVLESYRPSYHRDSRMTVKASGGPCCTANSLSPISLLYFDTNARIIRGELPDMVVNKCRCA